MLDHHTAILVIGFGSIGKRHYRNLIALGYDNVAVYDSHHDAFAEFPEIFRLKTLNASTFSSMKIVFVCTPTSLHVSYATFALAGGCDVFIDKPLSSNLRGVDTLIALAKKKKSIAMVACNFRFLAGFQKLQEVLRGQLFGSPLFARVVLGYYLPTARPSTDFKKIYAARKRDGGGVILDSGSHVVDYLAALFGDVRNLHAVPGKSRFLRIAAEESAVLMAEHRSGLTSVVSLDYLSRQPVHRLDIATTVGELCFDFRSNILVFRDDAKEQVLYAPFSPVRDMFIEQVRHFFACVEGRVAPAQDLTMSNTVLKLLLNARKTKY